MRSRVLTYLVAVVLAGVGAAGMVAGEADDSPGLQLIGVVFILTAVVLAMRTSRRSRRRLRDDAGTP